MEAPDGRGYSKHTPSAQSWHRCFGTAASDQRSEGGDTTPGSPQALADAKREIVAIAEEYLAEHPELIAEAKETALRWAAKGFFGKRAALAAHNSRVTFNSETAVPRGFPPNEYHAHNSPTLGEVSQRSRDSNGRA